MTGAVRSDVIHFVILNDAPPLLRHRVIRDGILLYARSEVERVRFVRRTLRDYLDMEPRLREQYPAAATPAEAWDDRAMMVDTRDPLAAARRTGRLLAAAAQPGPDE